MLEKFKYAMNYSSRPGPIFVIGSGRSGTHWLGYTIAKHTKIRATIETSPMFGLSTRMALNPDKEAWMFDILVWAYRWNLFKSAPKLYLDKTHPNIWIAEKLKKVFSKSLFLGIERNPYATVASMLKHKGVLTWHKQWRKFPVPNRFLGITKETALVYENIPLAAQCAMRWLAHHNRMNELKNYLKDSLMVISYEFFAYNPDKVTYELQQFLGLSDSIPIPDVNTSSLEKWKTQLTAEEIKQIEDIVGFSPDTTNYQEKTI